MEPIRPAAPQSRPTQERRKNERVLPEKVRAWLVNGQFEEIFSTVNFCKRLINLSPAGMCCETTGRLRAGVQMSAEIRFDVIGGNIRSAAKIVWVDTIQQGGLEIHRAGLQFVGKIEMTKPVREYFGGRSAVSIVATRQAEYKDLKAKSEARKAGIGGGKAGVIKKTSVTLLIILVLYLASFGGLIYRGRVQSDKPGIHFRYAGPESKAEETLAKIYLPLLRLFRAAGVDLNYEAPEAVH
jgi:hypothetical protein